MTIAEAPWTKSPGVGAQLPDHLRHWLRFPSPQVLLALCVSAAVVRIALGGFSWADGVVLLAILALQPFTEWAIHVCVLHFRPRRLWGREVDLHLAREHRSHHRDPTDAHFVFIPLRSLLTIVAVVLSALVVAIALGIASPRWISSLVASGAAMALVYEWVHYLVHSAHRPRTVVMKRLRRLHLLHHYKNESYWMGVTRHLADRILGTFPDPAQVETSPTARTLAGASAGSDRG